MGMGFAPTWLRQVTPPASHDHFNRCSAMKTTGPSCSKLMNV